MANTYAAINLSGDDWEDVSILTGIPDGNALNIQNLSRERVLVAISATKPSADFVGNILVADPRFLGHITAGETKVWLKGHGQISVQEG